MYVCKYLYRSITLLLCYPYHNIWGVKSSLKQKEDDAKHHNFFQAN